ncbi:MAG TPA: class I SAM-dependent methyltransferase [Stellaceae bacterium]|nr:class I SAM-dependent methyltransferase [Stellaceae bacterium]
MSTLDQLIMPRLRDYWIRLALRRVHYADRSDKLNRLYCVEDPWRMGSAREQARFAWTNRLIAEHLPPLETILEIGCGEGHQSQYLAHACRQLYGIDVSRRAVRRAERRCPAGKFAVGDPQSAPLAHMPAEVDLVTACEVIYYAKDVPAFLDRLSRLGRACLVTYYGGQAPALEPYFAVVDHCRQDRFRFGEVEWNAVWWHNRHDHDK